MKISPIYEGKIGIFRESVWFDLIGMIFETDMFYCMDGIFEIVIRKKQVLQGSIAPFSPEKTSWGSCETQEYQENPDLGGSSIFRHSPHLGWSWVEDGWRLLTKILVHGKWVLHFSAQGRRCFNTGWWWQVFEFQNPGTHIQSWPSNTGSIPAWIIESIEW